MPGARFSRFSARSGTFPALQRTGSLPFTLAEARCDGSFSNQPLTHLAKEFLGVGSRLLHGTWLMAEFHFNFLQCKFHGNFRPVASFDERPRSFRETGVRLCFWLQLYGRTGLSFTLVLAKLGGGQAIVSRHGLFAAQQRGNGVFPC